MSNRWYSEQDIYKDLLEISDFGPSTACNLTKPKFNHKNVRPRQNFKRSLYDDDPLEENDPSLLKTDDPSLRDRREEIFSQIREVNGQDYSNDGIEKLFQNDNDMKQTATSDCSTSACSASKNSCSLPPINENTGEIISLYDLVKGKASTSKGSYIPNLNIDAPIDIDSKIDFPDLK